MRSLIILLLMLAAVIFGSAVVSPHWLAHLLVAAVAAVMITSFTGRPRRNPMPDEAKPSKVLLAEALAEIPGMPPAMLQRAIDGYYHDYESPLALPEMQLVADLRRLHGEPTTGPKAKAAIRIVVNRVMEGDFDATREESDAWARSEEGQATFRELTESISRKHGKRRG